MWPACVSSPILSNVAPGHLLMGSFFLFSLCSVGSLYFGECLAPVFFLLDRGSDRGTCPKFFSTIGILIGFLLQIFVNILPSIIFSFLLK